MRATCIVLLAIALSMLSFTVTSHGPVITIKAAEAATVIIPVQGSDCFDVVYYDPYTGEVYHVQRHCG